MDNKPTSMTRLNGVSTNVQDACRRLPQELQHLKPRVAALLNRHSDLQSFMKDNEPEVQARCYNDEQRAVMSEISPTLTVIDKAYGEGAALVWLCKQLADFNEFCGKKEKMDDWQIEQLARGIILTLGYLKASEIMLFLYRYKMGHYGPLYGVIDPQEFMAVLQKKFIPWKGMIAEKAEGERHRKERESWRKNALKPDEIKKLKERIMNINDNLSAK